MGLPFQDPPLVQAVCELRFSPDSQWDITVPGLFYDTRNWKTEFPLREQQTHNQFQLDSQTQQMAFGVMPEVRVVLWNSEKNRSITLGINTLILASTSPYPGWLEFRELIKTALADYRQVAAPHGLARVGLRYINAIRQVEALTQIEDYTTAWPRIPLEENKNKNWASWAQRVEVLRQDLSGLLVIQTGCNVPDPNLPPAVMLDFDALSMQTPLDELSDWLELAHEAIEETFLQSLTTQARQLFGETKL